MIGDESSVVRMHSGDGEHREMDLRAEQCLLAAAHDVGLEQEVCEELRRYWRWATARLNAHPDDSDEVPDGLPFAYWPPRRQD